MLMIRAKSMAACAHFEKALAVASMAIDMDPTSSLVYLCKGHILAQQGYHQRAIQVYDAGISMDPQGKSSHSQLAYRKAKSEKAIDNRLDPMATLPNDIMLSNILTLVLGEKIHDYDTLRPYMEVSRTWCARVINASSYKMVIPSSSSICMEHQAMGEYAWLLQYLVLEDCHVAFPDIAKQWHFSSLKYLHIKGIVLQVMSKAFTNQSIGSTAPFTIDLVNALRISGFYLLDLTLDSENASGDHVIPVYRILETCPNLQSLTCIPAVPDADRGPREPKVYPQLRHLCLKSPKGNPSFSDMYHFLSQFPEVETLEAKLPFTSSRILTMVHLLCPKLKRLVFGNHGNDTAERAASDNLEMNATKGLCYLDIGMKRVNNETQAYSQDDVATICMHNHKSLQDFRYVGWLGDPCEIVEKSKNFTRLTMVLEQLSCMDIRLELPADLVGSGYFTWHRRSKTPQFPPLVGWMILHAPKLHTLTITTEVPIDVDVFTAMLALNNLTKLTLTLHEETTMQAMKAFLDHHYHLAKSPLSYLCITIKDQLNPTLVSSLARLSSLQLLHLDYIGPLMTSVFDSFVSALGVQHSKVKELQLSCQFQEIALSALQKLPDVGSLRTLKVHACKIPHGAVETLRNCKMLKALELRVESPGDDDDQLAETLSDIIPTVTYVGSNK